MRDDLLTYYNRELTYVRRLAAEFAEAHPKVAGNLRLTADAIEDPHVARLIEAFAFLTARVRLKLDDEFPELTDALFEVLYPHYLAPIPSCSVVQLVGAEDQPGGVEVARGLEIETEDVGGGACRYRTCYDTTLWPVEISAASVTGRPLVAPTNPLAAARGAVSSLRLTLGCLTEETTFTELGVDRLRVFLRGSPQVTYPLYELIFNGCVSIALADGPNDPNPVILEPDALRPVGFEADEALLPYSARTFPGYRLLTEYFAFPDKFLFFDLTGIDRKTLVDAGRTLEVFLYFDLHFTELERSVDAGTFALGCTPIVNLFSQRAEPIQQTETLAEYRVVPDARSPRAYEVYSIDGVSTALKDGAEIDYRPFYGVRHQGGEDADARRFWYASRRPGVSLDRGTEVYLAFVDLDFRPSVVAERTVSVMTTCTNRDLPVHLPFGGGRPALAPVEADAAITGIRCLVAPTAPVRGAYDGSRRWKLVSHLSLNHLSLTEDGLGTEALKEILRLYDVIGSAETRATIEGIAGVRCRSVGARAPGAMTGAVCRGIEVEIEFEDERFSSSGLFLLATVLERFLGLYVTINSFSRLVAKVKGRADVLRRWPPRAGDRHIL